MTSGNHKSIERLAEHVRALPLTDQLELMRRIAPAIVAEIDEEDRVDLITAINEEILLHAMGARPGA